MNKKATEKQSVNVGRICVILVGLVAAVLARDPDSEVLSLVSHAWAGFGAAFGPLVVLSLTWRRRSGAGAVAGPAAGAEPVLLWKIGKAAWRDRVVQEGDIVVVGGLLKTKTKQ